MPNLRAAKLKAQRFSDTWKLKDNLYFSKALSLGRTSRGRGGGGLVATTPKVFSDFFPWAIKHQHLKFSVDVRVYPSPAFWDKFSDGKLLLLRDMTSLVAGNQAIFEWKCMFFSTSFRNKSKTCG